MFFYGFILVINGFQSNIIEFFIGNVFIFVSGFALFVTMEEFDNL